MRKNEHEATVRARVKEAIERGAASFLAILAETDGADPRLVRRILDESGHKDGFPSTPAPPPSLSWDASAFQENLPASDPALGQWWYTSDTLERLAGHVFDLREDRKPFRILCIGSPTITPLLAGRGSDPADVDLTVVEADADILDMIRDRHPQVWAFAPEEFLARAPADRFHLCLLDPPWYREEMKSFFACALAHLEVEGYILISLPPLLTRPNILEERQEYLQMISEMGCSVVFLNRNFLHYMVPRFEEAAFQDVDGFSGKPWRVADLLVCRKSEDRDLQAFGGGLSLTPPLTKQRFYREAREFRVFLGPGNGQAPQQTTIMPVELFSSNVSRRAHDNRYPDVWTSEKVGASVEDMDVAEYLISLWSEGLSLDEAKQRFSEQRRVSSGTAEMIVKRYDDALKLWTSFGGGIGRRVPQEIRKAKDAARDERWASNPSDREHPSSSDGFRLDFQRDRDRVLWSGSLRKLSAKTQLFPFDEGDQLRQRLAHSLEVMQLASTIADSFGLDRDLVEAGALAHDIGHTPFGHAGEFALDRLLVRLDSNAPGFNHYEHGVDVVRYLEGPYQHRGPTGHAGLNLTPEVLECIFKHTYCQSGDDPSSHDEIRKKSKHASYPASGYSHLEGQAVRIADKISYLISDVEDGIRLGAIDDAALLSCRLFHRPPIDLTQPRGESLLRRFLLQRRNVLRVLMEDVISEAACRLARITSPQEVRSQSDYLIDHSSTFKADVSEVWKRLQEARLHQDPRVIAANMKAAKTVSELLLLLSVLPALIEKAFAAEHHRLWDGPYMRFYLNRMGKSVRFHPELLTFLPLDQFIGLEGKLKRSGVDIPTEDLVLAKDFVASLTDDQARKLHASLLGSSLSVR